MNKKERFLFFSPLYGCVIDRDREEEEGAIMVGLASSLHPFYHFLFFLLLHLFC
jgi:hypothetical protein